MLPTLAATGEPLNAASWDVDGVRDDPRAYVVKQFGDRDGILVVDEPDS